MTADTLKKLSTQQEHYMRNLAGTIKTAKTRGHNTIIEQNKATARGYIKGLIDCGVVTENEFRTLWCWFTELVNR